MSRERTAHYVVTANDLLEGDVVYLDPAGAWTRDPAGARLLADKAEAEATLARAAARADRVVGAYLAETGFDPETGAPVPLHYREAMRATGPSHRRDLGKQAWG